MNNFASTIAAISTPPGKGGVAIIRISGARAIEIAEKMFIPKSKKALSSVPARVQVFGDILYSGDVIDDGLATLFRAPHSFTGEDTVEISCHGGILITEKVLESAFLSGAVPAGAGEFTRRAFINGKLSLTEAEAVGNLLSAESEEQLKLASCGSLERLSSRINGIRTSLVSLLSSIYARIDYPDEELGDFSDSETEKMLSDILLDMEGLLSTYKTGKAVSEGVKTVICGKPNVGKSSLYNMLLERDAAIVTDIEGTTRDVLTEKISLGRVMLLLSDTAGIRRREDIDFVEKIGIERSLSNIKEAELILAVFDGSKPLDSEDKLLIESVSERECAKIAVINKSDLGLKISRDDFALFDGVIVISAKEDGGEGKKTLVSAVEKLFTDEKIVTGRDAIIFSARQNSNLLNAVNLTRSAIDALRMGISCDAVSSDIERALGSIAELDGRAVSEEVVADIFSKFCVGK